jgi:hypothetical protein
MTVPDGSKIPVLKIIPPPRSGIVHVSTHIAQNGDKIIILYLKAKNEAWGGFIATGKLSDYTVSKDADIHSLLQKLSSTVQRFGPDDGYSVSKD